MWRRAIGRAATVVTTAIVAGGCGGAARRGLPVGPLATALQAGYAPAFHASGHGSRAFRGLRLPRLLHVVGSCAGGRSMAITVGAVDGAVFCHGSGLVGGIANHTTAPVSTLVIRASARTRWAILVGGRH